MYRFELAYQSKLIGKYPTIPDNKLSNEDDKIERICVYETIPGCIMSLQIPYYNSKKVIDFNIRGKKLDLYLYQTIGSSPFDPNGYDIHYPTSDEVSDAFYTGEVWLLPRNKFIVLSYVAKYTIRVHEHLPNCCYSRYAVTREGYEEVKDTICSPSIYGDENAFSILLHNPIRDQVAYDYINKKGIGVDAYKDHGTKW